MRGKRAEEQIFGLGAKVGGSFQFFRARLEERHLLLFFFALQALKGVPFSLCKARVADAQVSDFLGQADNYAMGTPGPFPILNTALNVTKGADLGLQERKAESFVFTPLRSAFDFARRQTAKKRTNLSEYEFRRTEQFGDPANGGCLLGTAMAISGAAANSNSGFHTSPALAFLLTVLGVRLGAASTCFRSRRWRKSHGGCASPSWTSSRSPILANIPRRADDGGGITRYSLENPADSPC